MASSDPGEFSQWLVREWAERFQQSAEAMSGEPIQMEVAPLDFTPSNGDLYWSQPYDAGPGAEVHVLAPRATWFALGAKVLAAAGIDEAEEADSRATYLEILQQSLSGVASSLGGALGREVNTLPGQAVPLPKGAVPDGWLKLSAGPETPLGAIGIVIPPSMRAVVAPPGGGGAAPPGTSAMDTPKGGGGGEPASRAAPATGAGMPTDGRTGTDGRGGGDGRGGPDSRGGSGQTIELLYDVELPVAVSFGRAHLPLKEVIKLTSGSIVELNRAVAEPVELIVNNCVIARAEVVVVDGNYGVRILEIISQRERLRTLH